MRVFKSILVMLGVQTIAATVLLAASAQAADPAGSHAKGKLPTNQESLRKWRAMRFGLFIHWGPVSLKGTEIGWSRGVQVPVEEYDNLYKRFNPVKFDARQWVGLAKEAGMKYIVLTAKHHDGFSLWDSEYTDYDIMSTPFKRDIVKELSEECRRQGLMFCTYYSIIDWYHPDYVPRGKGDTRPPESANYERYVKFMKNQVRELITQRGPLGVMWFDGEWEQTWTHEHGLDLYAFVRGLKPDILVNNRVDKGRRGMQGMFKSSEFAGDFAMPEQQVGKFEKKVPWESCITICRQWAWKPKDRLKSLDECIRTLVSAAGGDGNLLLNVGPMPDGQIEPRQADRLKQIGTWMKTNGPSIYGTRGGPFKPTAWCASTHAENRIYLHVLQWPDKSDTVVLPPLGKKIIGSSLLAGGKVAVAQSDSRITVTVSGQHRQPLDTVVVLQLDGPASEIVPVAVGSGTE